MIKFVKIFALAILMVNFSPKADAACPSLTFGSQSIARDWFKKIQSCFSGVSRGKKSKRSNLGLSDIKLPSEKRKRKKNWEFADMALGMCENNYVVTAKIRYLSENTRTPNHSELIAELEKGCREMGSALFASFVPDVPLEPSCECDN